MKSYYTLFFHSLTDTTTYRYIATRSLKASIGYFLLSYVILSIIFTTVITLTVTPSVINNTADHLNSLLTQFPDEAEIIIQDGQMSLINVEPPLVITNQLQHSVIPFQNILIIDPQAVAQDIEELDSLTLLSTSAFSFQNLNNPDDLLIFPLAEIAPNTTITKANLTQTITEAQDTLTLLRRYAFPITFIAIFLGLIFIRSFYLLIFSVFSRTIGWVLGRDYTYQTFFILSLHTIVIIEIIHAIHFLLFPATINIFPLALLGINLIATLALPKTSPTPLSTKE